MAEKSENRGAGGGKDYHDAVAKVSAGVVRFFRKTFSETRVDGPKIDAAEVQKSPVMFVGTHRSHADYFMIGSNFCLMGFKNIRFAAGDNLTKLPWIGKKFLNFGAFAVSRDSGFERNYVRNLCAKVVEMLNDGDSVLLFPEGGRSYSGAMLDIRGGILNAALITQAADMSRDVYFVPSSVSYECPPDVPWFPLLLKGKKLRKKPTNFFKKALGGVYYFGADLLAFGPFMFARFVGKKYGAAYMDYGAPVPVKSLVDLEANRVRGARDEFAAHRVSLDIVGAKVRDLLVSIYRILPAHVVASIVKAKCAGGNGGVSMADLEAAADDMKALLNRSGRNCKTLNELTAKEIVTKGVHTLKRLKAVKITGKNVSISAGKPYVVDYYAATIAATATPAPAADTADNQEDNG